MSYQIVYHQLVVCRDLPALDALIKIRIKLAIETKLMTEPQRFGLHLRSSLKGYRKLRVGDYRVVFAIRDNDVQIFAIQHRSFVYESVAHRIM
jgi:mRNA interferase RelE/StbE